jgi:hypothetical protein
MPNPVITILGVNPVQVVRGNPYVDAGATAVDDAGVDLTPQISTFGTNINTSALGTRSVTYRVTDAAGQKAAATRIVEVVATAQAVLGVTPPPTPTASVAVASPTASSTPTTPASRHRRATVPPTTTSPSTTTPTSTVDSPVSDSFWSRTGKVGQLVPPALAGLLLFVIVLLAGGVGYLVIQNLRGAAQSTAVAGGTFDVGPNASQAVQKFLGRTTGKLEIGAIKFDFNPPTTQPAKAEAKPASPSLPPPPTPPAPEAKLTPAFKSDESEAKKELRFWRHCR